MLIDGVQLIEGSAITNFVLPTGINFPTSPNVGEAFYKTGGGEGLYLYTSALAWTFIAASEHTYLSQPNVPSSPIEGDRWVDTENNILYTYYYDGTSYQWVEF